MKKNIFYLTGLSVCQFWPSKGGHGLLKQTQHVCISENLQKDWNDQKIKQKREQKGKESYKIEMFSYKKKKKKKRHQPCCLCSPYKLTYQIHPCSDSLNACHQVKGMLSVRWHVITGVRRVMCRKTEADLCCFFLIFLWCLIFTLVFIIKKYIWLLSSVELYGLDCELVCVWDCFTSGPWAAMKCSWKPHNSTWGIYMLHWMNISLTHRSDMQPASQCVCTLPHALSVCIRVPGPAWLFTFVWNLVGGVYSALADIELYR